MRNKKAFTLIELLVVVLIIGILAAVALPQYNKAVAKSRVARMLPLFKAVVDAKEVYYMDNGTYEGSDNITTLDVLLPAECKNLESNHYFQCGNDWLIDNNSDHPAFDYCPGHNNKYYPNCFNHRDFRLVAITQQSTKTDAGTVYCSVMNNSKLGQDICENLPGFTVAKNKYP